MVTQMTSIQTLAVVGLQRLTDVLTIDRKHSNRSAWKPRMMAITVPSSLLLACLFHAIFYLAQINDLSLDRLPECYYNFILDEADGKLLMKVIMRINGVSLLLVDCLYISIMIMLTSGIKKAACLGKCPSFSLCINKGKNEQMSDNSKFNDSRTSVDNRQATNNTQDIRRDCRCNSIKMGKEVLGGPVSSCPTLMPHNEDPAHTDSIQSCSSSTIANKETNLYTLDANCIKTRSRDVDENPESKTDGTIKPSNSATATSGVGMSFSCTDSASGKRPPSCWSSADHEARHSGFTAIENSRRKLHLRAMVTVGLILLSANVSMAPFVILRVVRVLNSINSINVSFVLSVIVNSCAGLNALLDPFVYCFRIEQIRMFIKNELSMIFCRSRR